MSKNYDPLLKELGVNVELHNKLIESMSKSHEKTHLSQKNRPESIEYFDNAFHGSHGERVEELYNYRKGGGKSIGTFCIYVPDEIAYAAEVEPFALCGGSGWSVNYADTMFPRDICPLVRSTFGMALSGTCPYKKLKDFALGETTCDAKKKTWDLLGIKTLEVPQRKNPIDRDLWKHEVYAFKDMVESLSQVKVTPERLSETIKLVNRKRKILQRINDLRKLPNPPISGVDALLVSQISLNHNINKFIEAGEKLIKELEERHKKGISAYTKSGPRIMIAGTPSPMGYAKVHHVVESCGMQVVVDESCTGQRYYSNPVDETKTDLEGMMTAIADRYFKIDCPCFSPNKERIDNIVATVKEYSVQGVVQSILMYCHGFNVEAKVIENALDAIKIPSLKIVTDYSDEDLEQIGVRMESFRDMLLQ